MKQIHGGDIYDKQIQLDFSVNINPLGIPEKVQDALENAVRKCMQYPQPDARMLQEQTGRMLGVPFKNLIFGNGAFYGIGPCIKAEKDTDSGSVLLWL